MNCCCSYRVVRRLSTWLGCGPGRDITRESVHYTLGFPRGAINIQEKIDTQAEFTYEMVAEWRKQFPNERGQVKPGVLKKALEESREGGWMFKKNFLVLLVTLLMEGKLNCYVNQSILKALDDESTVRDLDRCGYTLHTLIKAKDFWNKDRTRHFPGSLLFLIIFYVDRLVFKGGDCQGKHHHLLDGLLRI
ncbi:unnamed protein product [Cuscuta europaea]|uniref:Uncharacterized protein n=1 Tax=Cuscuta europaea TaxID=41803 RepID=A0A9P1E7N5_CUSEU|nr:unnamed protein product [Cuscuta europaea]